MFGCSNPKYKKNCILRLAYNILKFPKRLFDLRKKNAFDKYQKSHLNITARRYRSNEELKELPYGDIYICGSDQIWNPLFKNGNDPAFYLDFAPTNKTRVSYAASLAVDQIPEDDQEFMKCMITGLNAVSVREEKGVQLLSELGIQSIRVVDPVFLHDKEFWVSEIAKTRLDCLNQKYIFVYDFDKNEAIKSFAIDYARANDLKIVTAFRSDYATLLINIRDPNDFLALIKNAEFVISNSFHATAFSIIFEKRFAVVGREEKVNSRMIDLLNLVGLQSRILTAAFKDEPIDYREVQDKMGIEIKKSKSFLGESLSGRACE